MPSTREMRLRIRSVKNISQVTRALETVSASKVRKAMQSTLATKAYAEQSWKVLMHLAGQPGSHTLHPLLNERETVKNVLIVMISGDRGLAGAYNVNVLRNTLDHAAAFAQPVSYVTVGRKGRDLLLRRRRNIIAEFSNLTSPATYLETAAIGKLLVEDFLNEGYDQVYLSYTEFVNMMIQRPVFRKLLPLELPEEEQTDFSGARSVFTYEPDQGELLNQIIPRFTALQVYQAILSSQASEHAARMVAMRNATENGQELIHLLQLDYNKARQQIITNEMLDIVGGANALSDGN